MKKSLNTLLAGLREGLLEHSEVLLEPLHRTPRIAISMTQLKSLDHVDHATGFLISLIDGTTDLSYLLAVSPLPRAEAALELLILMERGVIAV